MASFRVGRHAKLHGYTLIEAVAVLSLLAVLFAAAATSFHIKTIEIVSAKSEARRLAEDVIRARRLAIATGQNHVLEFRRAAGRVEGYTLYRRGPSGLVQVSPYHPFSERVTVTLNPVTDPEFTFEGAAQNGGAIRFAGGSNQWDVEIAQATGSVRMVRR